MHVIFQMLSYSACQPYRLYASDTPWPFPTHRSDRSASFYGYTGWEQQCDRWGGPGKLLIASRWFLECLVMSPQNIRETYCLCSFRPSSHLVSTHYILSCKPWKWAETLHFIEWLACLSRNLHCFLSYSVKGQGHRDDKCKIHIHSMTVIYLRDFIFQRIIGLFK